MWNNHEADQLLLELQGYLEGLQRLMLNVPDEGVGGSIGGWQFHMLMQPALDRVLALGEAIHTPQKRAA